MQDKNGGFGCERTIIADIAWSTLTSACRRRIADVLERRDREEQDRKRSRTAPEQPNGSDQDHTAEGHPPEVAERVQSQSHGGASSSRIPTEEDVVMGDDMVIHLAKDDVLVSEAKKEE